MKKFRQKTETDITSGISLYELNHNLHVNRDDLALGIKFRDRIREIMAGEGITYLKPQLEIYSRLLKEQSDEYQQVHRRIARARGRMEQSILADSRWEIGVGEGKDNKVLTTPKRKNSYVFKYSRKDYPASPRTVEYLQKKYALLRKLMPDHIPKSGFIFGERETSLRPDLSNVESAKRKCAITIQRRVLGKTFREMTEEERLDPIVVQKLTAAHKEYFRAKKLVKKACEECNLPLNTLDIKLDIGLLSDDESHPTCDESDIKRFKSPNVMFDPKTQEIMFIDFDMNDWNDQKEVVFQYLMNQLKSPDIASD